MSFPFIILKLFIQTFLMTEYAYNNHLTFLKIPNNKSFKYLKYLRNEKKA